ncbi:MAG: GH25 family lysozyme [Elusimicrobiota bacterium]|jgi:lysozyme
MKKYLIGATTLLLLGSLVVWGYFAGHWRLNYPSQTEFRVRGIDVSHHQGEIDWQAVAKEGYRFVYIKATEGGDFKDSVFQRNWAEAKLNGLAVGAYHFFTFCKPGKTQAANLIESVPEEAGALPPVIDFEFVGNCAERPPKEDVLKELSAFADIVEKKYRKPPVLYVTSPAYSQYLAGQADRYRLWIRDVFRRPGRFDERDWTIWQYSDNTRVNGIHGLVDQNVFNGNEEGFQSFLQARANHSLDRPAAK